MEETNPNGKKLSSESPGNVAMTLINPQSYRIAKHIATGMC